MKLKATVSAIALGLGLAMGGGSAMAEGELHLFNWGNYTAPDLIEAFEKAHGVEVTIDDYDSNEAMLAKVKVGSSGYDVTVPSDYMVKIMIEEGLLLQSNPHEMENFQHIGDAFRSPYWDPKREYSVPWLWGTTGISVNTNFYDVGGAPNDRWSWSIVMDPPEELRGKINMVSEMNDVIAAGLFYLGKDQCNDNRDDLRELNDLLQSAKEHWRTIEYGIIEKLTSLDVYASHNWNGASMRARLQIPEIVYVYPKEGLVGWADNVVILADAPNVENARLFLNFIMAPENAAMMSNFARYANSVDGSEQHMEAAMSDAPEVNAPNGTPTPTFIPPCPREVTELYTKIWNNLLK